MPSYPGGIFVCPQFIHNFFKICLIFCYRLFKISQRFWCNIRPSGDDTANETAPVPHTAFLKLSFLFFSSLSFSQEGGCLKLIFQITRGSPFLFSAKAHSSVVFVFDVLKQPVHDITQYLNVRIIIIFPVHGFTQQQPHVIEIIQIPEDGPLV